ncbi:Spy/CpxP family protein refolding chaperone [Hydrogenophaga sp. PAMC20947]|uniref:Spy/CpxP family protein refolding chaperone n=1 Tax=Hydrogenophaga sp. PAMC20947 TaxID=2565558 RepID=UPI00109DB666|nr:Spy/CpxP family protein refolding chaperone [Hydrogenophaga sp. PAMC20947]QCB46093.1 periplasmic heavy metal sensor [Hydrogenophaga sp. PAMC20947]
MKPWIKKTLIGLTSVTVVLGGLSACGSRGHHGEGWSAERVSEVRGKVVEKISGKLELDVAQKQKLGTLADQIIASRTAFRGESADPRTELKTLIAGEKFDRTAAQTLLDQKTQAIQGNAPQTINALADFFDSLNPEQQKQVREKLERRHGWWGRG